MYLDKNVISGWQIDNNASILVLPPFFPVSLPPITGPDMDNEASLFFALQGNHETERRDYAHIFDSLSSFNKLTSSSLKTATTFRSIYSVTATVLASLLMSLILSISARINFTQSFITSSVAHLLYTPPSPQTNITR